MRKLIKLKDGSEITIRPIRPEDAGIEQAFVQQLSPESRRRRFLIAISELTPHAIERFTRPEYPQEQALIATISEGGKEKEIGVARYAGELDSRKAEFAIVIADSWQGKGLGPRMMWELFDAAAAAGMQRIEGVVLRDNRHMLEMVRNLGFAIEGYAEDPGLAHVCIDLPLPKSACDDT